MKVRDRSDARVVVTEVADGAVLLDQASGAFYHLNPTGALVYALLLDGDRTIVEVAHAVAAAFPHDEAATLRDVQAFANELARHGLVRARR